jgi:hypothetical protein
MNTGVVDGRRESKLALNAAKLAVTDIALDS